MSNSGEKMNANLRIEKVKWVACEMLRKLDIMPVGGGGDFNRLAESRPPFNVVKTLLQCSILMLQGKAT